MVTIPEVIEAISMRAEGRYEIDITGAAVSAMKTTEIESHSIQLKRIKKEGAGRRTVLIAAVPYETSKIQAAFRWAADVRDILPEPQTADLYMFMLIEGVPTEDAARIETDDRFCRKLVLREQEEVGSLLDRCFLATLSPAGSSTGIGDPFLASLASLELEHSWVVPHINTWQKLLLSGQAGGDIAEALKLATFGKEEMQ